MRTFIYSIFPVLFLLMLLPVSVFAQSDDTVTEESRAIPPEAVMESDEPMLIANVNFSGVSTSTEGVTAVAVFTLKNSFGRQDGITYGVVMRSEKTGNLLASLTAKEAVSLEEGESVSLDFVYEVPTYLSETASVLLAAYNAEGLPLAFYPIDTVAGNVKAVSCTSENDTITCDVDDSTNAEMVIREGSPQGKIVHSETVTLREGSAVRLSDIIDQLVPGRYIASVILSDQGTGDVVGAYATDFTKDGAYGKLMSVSPRTLPSGELEVVVYAEIGQISSETAPMLSVDLGDCADAQEVAFDAPVKTLRFATRCEGGTITTQLTSGKTVLDTSKVAFGEAQAAVPADETTSIPTTAQPVTPMNGLMAALLILGGLVLLVVVLWYFAHRKNADSVVPPATMVLAYLALATVLAGFANTAEAATFNIGGSPSYNTCVVGSGMGCAEPDTAPGANRTATVIVPDSVPQGSVYTVQYSAIVNNSTGTTCSGSPCTAANNEVEVYNGPLGPGMGWVGVHLVTTYNTLPSGYHGSRAGITRPLIHSGGQTTATRTFTHTASSTGTTDTLSFLLGVGGTGIPVSSCTYSWCLTHPYAKGTVTVNLTAANVAPTSNAGTDRSITLPTNSVTISGASATDPDGSIASRAWAFVSGPGTTPTITNGTTLTPTFSGMTTAGTYIFRLTVTDNAGATDTDTMQVVVTAPASSCSWDSQTYLGLNTGNPGMHNTTRCSTPAPSDGTPGAGYCNNLAEDGTTVVCCDSGADCYRYTCDFKNTCSVPAVDLNFE